MRQERAKAPPQGSAFVRRQSSRLESPGAILEVHYGEYLAWVFFFFFLYLAGGPLCLRKHDAICIQIKARMRVDFNPAERETQSIGPIRKDVVARCSLITAALVGSALARQMWETINAGLQHLFTISRQL